MSAPSAPGTGPEAATAPSAPAAGPPASEAARPRRRLRYAAVGIVLVGAFAFLLTKGLGSALDFYLTADQAVAQEATLGGRTINLEGVVKPGTIRSTPVGVDFTVTSGAAEVAVSNTGSPPDLFQADIPVIAVGHFASGVFVSDQILVKHSSTYVAKHPTRVTAPDGSKR